MVTDEESSTVRVDFFELEPEPARAPALAVKSGRYRFEPCVRAGAKRAYREVEGTSHDRRGPAAGARPIPVDAKTFFVAFEFEISSGAWTVDVTRSGRLCSVERW